MRTIAIMRACDGVCIDLIDTDATFEELDARKRLSDFLPADRIAQLQHCGTCVDAGTEVFAAVA
jgi:hypothetical protein